MALLFVLLAILLTVGFIWLITTTAQGEPFRVDGGTVTYRHSLLLRGFSLFALFGVGFVLIVGWILFPPKVGQSYLPLILMALTLAFASFLLCWESFQFQLQTTPDQLICDSPWSGRRHLSWSELSSLDYSTLNMWFILKFRDGRAVRISALVPGISKFLDQCEHRLKPEQLVNAQKGYEKLKRKWPYATLATQQSKPQRWMRRVFFALVALILLPVLLFVLNGCLLGTGDTPIAGTLSQVTLTANRPVGGEVRIVAYNIAKGFAHSGGLNFAAKADVEARLKLMAKVISDQNPDIVFLSEVMTECGPANVNQLEFLARECGLPHYSFGENYNFGFPFFRVLGGNAILSRTVLKPVANIPLRGRQPFYVTRNNRRALFASTLVGEDEILLASLHNDSFNIQNNEAQVHQLLDFIAGRACVLAGDFNAQPNQPPIVQIQSSGNFSGEFSGPPTFPEKRIRIDYIFGPKKWTHLQTQVIENDASDHRAVFSRFQYR
jgi:endonuclease/exonuclease/phosphatase family metal-dependent hydrolase